MDEFNLGIDDLPRDKDYHADATDSCDMAEWCPHLADAQRYHWLKKQSVANRMLIATIAWRYKETTKYSHDQLDEIIDTAIRKEENRLRN